VTWVHEQDIAPETLLANLIGLEAISEEMARELGLKKAIAPSPNL